MIRYLLISFLASSPVFANTTYKIDSKASTAVWTAYKKLGDSHTGQIQIKEGEISLDKKGSLVSGHFVIDMATISNDDLKGKPDYQKKLVAHLSNDDFFKVDKFKESTFKITEVKRKSEGEFTVTGDLTMIGKTKSLEFPVKVSNEGGLPKGEASITVDRTKWGLKYGSGNFFKELTADKIIKDEFKLDVKIATIK